MAVLKFLMIEDEIEHCNLYKKYLSSVNNKHSLIIANGVTEGLAFLQKYTFDFILLDLELNYSDGNGLHFLGQLKLLKINHPYVIVITQSYSKRTLELARKKGADFVYLKFKPDYSPKLVIEYAETIYPDLSNIKPVFTDEIRGIIEKAIRNIGINGMLGKRYLIEAIYIAKIQGTADINLSKDVYPQIGAKYQKSAASVEKAIGNAIKKAWNTVDLELIYSFHYSDERGMPTPKDFICHYADML